MGGSHVEAERLKCADVQDAGQRHAAPGVGGQAQDRVYALAVAVQTGLAGPGAYDHLPQAKQPHLHLRGIDELLSLCREQGKNR